MLVGIDIGGTKTAVILSAHPPETVWRAEFETRPELGPEQAIRKTLSLVHTGLAQHGVGTELQAIGVSCGGPLERANGLILSPPNLPTWNAVPITAILEAEFNVPCALNNDANAGALAEHQFGAGECCKHMVFLTMGTGLGAGLILNGELFYGASDMAGEIGHVRLTSRGPVGHNKAGSAEGWASGGGMAKHGAERVREAKSAGVFTVLSAFGEALTAKQIASAAQDNDGVAMTIVEETGHRLGEALAVLVDVLNPERIVVGGLGFRLGERLLGPARRRMSEEALSPAVLACQVLPARLGERIGDVAALCVAMSANSERAQSTGWLQRPIVSLAE